jgi:hypothetical protein
MSQLEINPDNKVPSPIRQEEEETLLNATGQVKPTLLLTADSFAPSAGEIQTLNIERYSIEPGRPTIPGVNLTVFKQAGQTDPRNDIATNEMANIIGLVYIDEAGKVLKSSVAQEAKKVENLISELEDTLTQLKADNALINPEDTQWTKDKIAEFKEVLANIKAGEEGKGKWIKMAALNELAQDVTALTNILSSGEIRAEDLLTQAKEKVEQQLADNTIPPELAEKIKEEVAGIEEGLNQMKELEKATKADSGLTWAKTGSLFALSRALLELIGIMNELELKEAQAANTLNAAETKMGAEIAKQIEAIGRLRAAEKFIQAAQSLTSAGIGLLQVKALASNTVNVQADATKKVEIAKAKLDEAKKKDLNDFQGGGVAEQPEGAINQAQATPPESPKTAQAKTEYENALAAAAPREVLAQTNINATGIQAQYTSYSQSIQGAGTMASAGMESKIAEEESAKQEQEVRRETLRKTEEKTNKNANDMGNMRSGEYQVFVKLTEASHKRASSAA